MFKFFTSILMSLVIFATSCTTPLGSGDVSALIKWTGRLQVAAADIATLSENESTKAWSGQVAVLLTAVKTGLETGELQTVPGLLNKVRELRPILVQGLKESGKSNEDILLILIGLDVILVGLEESIVLPPVVVPPPVEPPPVPPVEPPPVR